jgi:hypothetical protein
MAKAKKRPSPQQTRTAGTAFAEVATAKDMKAVKAVFQSHRNGLEALGARFGQPFPDLAHWTPPTPDAPAETPSISNTPDARDDEPLTDMQEKVFAIIEDHGPITGKAIIALLPNGDKIDQSALTTHIIPPLKQLRGVRNKRGAGYYVCPPE